MRPEQLRKLRKDLHMSQAAFAEYVGISENAVSLYERGHTKIPKAIQALAFGLWFERVAGVIPSFTAMLSSDSEDIAATVALVESKKELGKTLADIELQLGSRP